MRNKFFSLLLLAISVATLLLTSCSDVETDFEEDTSTISEIKLTLYGIKGEGTTEEAVKAVEEEINKITQDKYKTTLELHLLDEAEYEDTIEDAFVSVQEQTERTELAEKAATAAAKAARLAAKELPVEQQKEKKRAQREYEAWGEERGLSMEEISVTMSDDIELDIFLVDNRERYFDLIEREKLADISSYVTGTYGIITKYVSPLILSVAKSDGMYYGVPANKKLATGDNEGYYYAFKTELLEKYPIDIPTDSSMTLNSLDPWLEEIAAKENCTVFFAPPAVIQNFDFYDDDMESFPAYGTKNIDARATSSTELEYTFEMGSGQNAGVAFVHFKRMGKYRKAGYFAPEGSDPTTTDFAVGVFQGTLDDVKAQLGAQADEYSYYTYAAPKTTTEDAFGSTFVVSASCKYPSRAVEVISAFYTNEKIRNLITFGVEDVHYEVNLDGETVEKISNDYNIGFETYGNSLIGYVPEELGADYQKNAIERNRTVKASAFIGFNEEVEDGDIKAFEKINELAKRYIKGLMNGEADVDAVLEEATDKMGKYEDGYGLYPKENLEGEYTPVYNILLENLNGSFEYFSETRPGGSDKIDNNIITSEERRRREEEAALLNPVVEEVAVEEPTVEE